MDSRAIIGILIAAGVLAAVVVGGLVAAALLARRARRRRQAAAPAAEAAQPVQTPETLCPNCHQPLVEGAVECPHCGHLLQAVSPVPQAVSPVAQPAAPPSVPAVKSTGGSSPPRLSQSQVSLAGPRLFAVSGPLRNQAFLIPAPPEGLTIGRNPDNKVVLASVLMVSRYHAQIMPEGSEFVLYDRDSVNGTLVNDVRVFRHVLSDGDRIQICDTQFVFSISGSTPAAIAPAPDAGPAAPKSGSLEFQLNETFEGYVLEKRLGRGGMSVVYKARSPEGRVVALKILNVTDDYIVRKFVQEEQIGAALNNHPNIRAIHRLGRSASNQLYLEMEYIEGEPLRKRIGRPLNEDEVVATIGQTCDALHYAHQRRVVHRDIKPENILIASDGCVKVTDFGIAKLTSSVTVTSDRIVGTPEYLSPEQAKGEQTISPVSDVYSAGVVMYEMLCGHVPFPLPKDTDMLSAALTVLSQHVNTPPMLPCQVNPRVSPKMEKIVMRALEKEPQKRFPNAAAMCKAIGYDPSSGRRPALSPVPPLHAYLLIVEGENTGRSIPLTGASTVVGRQQLSQDDISVSRRHFTVTPRGQQFWLEDTSLNGTFVNGERVYGEIALHLGDEIVAGKHHLRVVDQPPQ